MTMPKFSAVNLPLYVPIPEHYKTSSHTMSTRTMCDQLSTGWSNVCEAPSPEALKNILEEMRVKGQNKGEIL